MCSSQKVEASLPLAVMTREPLAERLQKRKSVLPLQSKFFKKILENQIFLRVEMAEKGVHCSAGDSHTAVLTEEGAVWLWGTFRDANGRLGMRSGNDDKEGEGEKAVLQEPTKLDLPTKVKVCNFHQFLALDSTTGLRSRSSTFVGHHWPGLFPWLCRIGPTWTSELELKNFNPNSLL